MPLYKYRCESCGSEFTVLVRQKNDGDDIVCPDCGSSHTRKVVSRVAVQFKGSGYYKTDYARRGKSEAGKKSSSSGQVEESASQEASLPSPKADSSKDVTASNKSKPHRSSDKQRQQGAKASLVNS
jgi:putative FmdB family regulatory protein